MEGSESEHVFDSLNLNPQLFINEILNAVDDMMDGAFDFYQREAPVNLGLNDSEKSKELTQGISSLRYMIQELLDKRLGMWEKYCLQHCFAVPEGFSLPKHDPSGDSLLVQAGVSDAELDTQLDSLREKLTMVGREAAELTGEVYALEKQSILSRAFVEVVNEVSQEYNSMHDMFQEMIKASLELRTKMKKLKIKRREELDCARLERIGSPNEDHYVEPDKDEWWRNFGIDDLELQTLAIRILSRTCSSSGCERNWSVFERIYTKRRNRLEHKRLNDLVYTHYNLRLKERQASRKSLTDPISLENIDLTDDWVVEAEDDDAPLLDVDEIDDWMDVADAILDEGEGGAAAGLTAKLDDLLEFVGHLKGK